MASSRGAAAKSILIVLLILGALAVGLRVVLPLALTRIANDKLASMPGYTGHIDDVDLALWRGHFWIKGLRLDKTGGQIPVPFISVPEVEVMLRWGALFRGMLSIDVDVTKPEANFVAGPSESTTQLTIDERWLQLVQASPAQINTLRVHDATVWYRDFHSDPKVDIYLTNLQMRVENLQNLQRLDKAAFAHLFVEADAMKTGHMKVEAALAPKNERPTFDLDAELVNLELMDLNDFLRAYANVDVQGGTFSVYSEFESDQGRFRGYIKPIVEEIEVFSWKQDHGIQKLWEGLVGAVAELFEAEPQQRIATRIEITGRFEDPNIGTFGAIVTLVRNAFVAALQHGIEGRISFGEPGSGVQGQATPAQE